MGNNYQKDLYKQLMEVINRVDSLKSRQKHNRLPAKKGASMNKLQKPCRLCKGDTIAAVSPCHGWAGEEATRWKYELGATRLRELGLNVISAPNSLRGTSYLSENPRARAEDMMWAFENKEIKAIIANVGGNDSLKVIPYIDTQSIIRHPKIFIGYSDVMNLHLLCRQCGLSSFYGDNLLEPVGEARGWHSYSRKWFEKVLFDPSPIGPVEPAEEWTWEENNYTDPSYTRSYCPNSGYELLQGQGIVQGRLLGGHTGLAELDGTSLALSSRDFEGCILFIEDIPDFFTEEEIVRFLQWLEQKKILSAINGILIGKAAGYPDFSRQKQAIRSFMASIRLEELPILYGVHFGHSSPVCVLPYGAMAQINCTDGSFAILESGVL